MKQYISIFMLICFASFSSSQNQSYDKLWKEVSKLENEGLTKSASQAVDKIYAQAKSENNTVQRIKSVIHQSKYLQILEEDSQLKIVNNFKAEIKTSDTATKHLLENLLANLYWQYFKQNRYKFYNRSKTSEKVDDDFRTWDLETLFKEVHCYFQSSLEDKDLLQKEALENYDALLVTAENSKEYRPTLFDFLSHNALDFYKTPENNITKPAYKFIIDSEAYLAPNPQFINLNLKTKDSINLQFNALKIYQNLLVAHQKDKTSKAFISNNLERIEFVRKNASFDNKMDVALATLQTELDGIKSNKNSTLYSFQLAKLTDLKGSDYNPNIEKTAKLKWLKKEALAICAAAISKFPNSDDAKNCKVLKAKILQSSFNLSAERFIPINEASLILVTYENLNQLNFDAYKVSESQIKAFNNIYETDKKSKFLSKLKAFKSFDTHLKSEDDYQKHSTEVVMPALENGHYIIVATAKDSVFNTAIIQVTNMALLSANEGKQMTYQVLDRRNGAPITDAKVELSYRTNKSTNITLRKNFTTDNYGKFHFDKDGDYYNTVKATVTNGNETGTFGNYYISRKLRDRKNTSSQYKTYIFKDRSIYRPGQTVYFKGIVTEKVSEKTSVLADETMTVTLHNVNGEKLNELSLKTNEFGSFNGEFILPNNGLTGQFSIRTYSKKVRNNNSYFSVEEYKRPKFETTFKPVTETYKVNDSVTVKGNAIAFAGSNITDAKVVYRVKRNVQMPRWYYWGRSSNYGESQEITFGEIKTDNKGEFSITFKAIPDATAKKENLPVFSYEITADVTDINGETRSATTTVRVGYHALNASIIAAQRIDKSEKNIELELSTTNLNGEFTPAKGTLNIYKLTAPDYVLRQRPWNAPDYKLMTKDEFKTKFPHWSYVDEQKLENWTQSDAVFTKDFDTEESKKLALKRIKNWESGTYIITLDTKDKFGQAVKDKMYTVLFSDNDKKIADNKLFDISLDKTEYQPEENATLTFGTSAEDLEVTIEIEKNGTVIDTQIHKLNDSKKTLQLPITKTDIGGFVVHYSFSAFNDFEGGKLKINVPYPKTDLQIETSTFRDKLQPGQDETWQFKIKGPKGDKVAAEVLASMYDASLDEFKGHNWRFNPISRPNYYSRSSKNSNQSYGNAYFNQHNMFKGVGSYTNQSYDRLNWFGFYFGRSDIRIRGYSSIKVESQRRYDSVTVVADEIGVEETLVKMKEGRFANSAPIEDAEYQFTAGKAKLVPGKDSIIGAANMELFGVPTPIAKPVQIRKNLQETAFFFPQLQTDKDGNVSFNFKAPEALTKWKLQLLAHTKTLESAVSQYETVTQKELMVIPNAPRFLRQGDDIVISTKIANLTDKNIKGLTQLILEDAITGKDVSDKLIGQKGIKDFSVDAKGNTSASWTISIPDNIQAIQYQVVARSENFSDGEQNVLPVLTNRMLVTESLPMWVRSNQTKTFSLDKLKDNTSTTLKNHKLTLEITSNPAWYAVQALPYLMEYPYDCNEQTFSRYYANALAQHITKSNPRIEEVFNQWRSSDALLSNLEKNQELKSILIEETPWLRDAQSETEQKKRIALLFDLNKMNNELQSSLRKLKNNQHNTGAWPWFNGGSDNRYITQHIVSGFGHLRKLGVTLSTSTALSVNSDEAQMIEKAIQYLDSEFVKEYKNLKKYNSDVDLKKDHLSYMQLQYLYMRSFFPKVKKSKEVERIADYYQSQIKKYWLKRSLYAKGLMALIMHRNNEDKTAGKILKSLKENSITSDELGMYWKANTASWYWHQAPIETQALLIEAFSEVGSVILSETKNLETIDNLKIWLLKNKQTNKWETTKATADAVYALLLQGSEWLSVTDAVDVTVGNEKISPSTLENVKVEAGTGYFKTSWNASEIKPEQAQVTLSKKYEGIAWGAMYWQYFEDLDKITTAETPLKLEKKLFLKSNTDTGEEISEITANTNLNVGDLVKVRIELRSDRDMEFLHLKDMRAAGFEPTNVISRYKWQDGFGYYESTKDAATNFFIDYLPKGVYVFEYDLRVNNAGDMSNGITTIQSMYAPEFSSHSEGIRVKVD